MYRVKDWDTVYESSESRKLKGSRYVCTPNKHDGKGYKRMLLHPRKVELFCAWNLIIQVASKCPKRGELVDRDGPITPADMELKTGFAAELFELAFTFFSSGDKLAWLDPISGGFRDNIPTPRENLPEPRETSGDSPVGDFAPVSAPSGDFPGISRNPPEPRGREKREIEEIEEREEREESVEDARARTPRSATQADYNRAKQVLDLYPSRAKKDNRAIVKDLPAQNALAVRIAKDPDYPWEEHARLMAQEETPKNAHAWALGLPDPIALEHLRSLKAPAAAGKEYYR